MLGQPHAIGPPARGARRAKLPLSMPTFVLDPPPLEIDMLLERRRLCGTDTHDEMWEGVLHLAPAPHDRHADVQAQIIELLGPLGRAAGLRIRGELNIGGPDDYRVPDAALRRQGESELWNATAALAAEVLSPGDETPHLPSGSTGRRSARDRATPGLQAS